MIRARRPLRTGLATLAALAGAFVFTAAPALAAPEMPMTEAAEEISGTTATLHGELNPLSKALTGYEFTYGTGGTCEGATTEAGAEAEVQAAKVSTPVAGLAPNTEYMFCVVATHTPEGEPTEMTAGSAVPFKTIAVKPAIDSESVAALGATTTTLEALVNPNNQVSTGYLQYSTSAAVNASGALEAPTATVTPPGPELGANYEDHPVGPVELRGLAVDQKYYYQAVALNPAGVTYGPVQEFTTLGAPIATVGQAQNITRTSATFSGAVNPVGAETTYYVAYISEAGYQAALAEGAPNLYAEGETTAALSTGASYEAQAVGPLLATGLLPETTYRYALVATNSVGPAAPIQDGVFTTLSRTPATVTTEGASAVTQNAAMLVGTVTTNGLQTQYGFEIGTEAGNYGPATGLGNLGGATTEVVAVTLGGLRSGATYYYRVTATNQDGTSYGEPKTFTTPGFPTLLAAPTSPPLVATPAVTFPREEQATTTLTLRTVTNAQKLTTALKVCHKYKQARRAGCEKKARKKYGVAKKKR